jgi:hypothetical protein
LFHFVAVAAVDAALGVDLIEICSFYFAFDAVSGCWSAVWHNVAYLYFGISPARIIFFLGKRIGVPSCQNNDGGRQHCQPILES